MLIFDAVAVGVVAPAAVADGRFHAVVESVIVGVGVGGAGFGGIEGPVLVRVLAGVADNSHVSVAVAEAVAVGVRVSGIISPGGFVLIAQAVGVGVGGVHVVGGAGRVSAVGSLGAVGFAAGI